MFQNNKVETNIAYHEVINDIGRDWEKSKSEKYHQYRIKWNENPKNFILEDAPLHLDIDITNICNLKCPMCTRTVLISDENKKNKFQVGSMKFDTYKKIIDEAADIGVYSIKLQWLGEPLIHPKVIEMIKYAKEKGIIDVMLNTNAVLLDEKMSEELIESGLDKIFFSFDSPFKTTYEKIRVGAKFEETLKNIKAFTEIRNKMGNKSPLARVSMVLMEENKHEYEDFVKLFKDIVDIVSYQDYINAKKEEKKYIDKDKKFACSELWQRMVISWNCDCVVCCGDSEKEYVVGNIHSNTIKEIWQNDKYNKIREKHRLGKWYEVEMCRKCDLPNK